MAGGVLPNPGFIERSPDVFAAGEFEWASTSGIEPFDPIMSGGGGHEFGGPGYDADRRYGAIATLPLGQAPGPSMGEAFSDSWRDLLDWKHSPAPWVLLFALAAIGLVQLRVAGRAGPFGGHVGVG